MPVPALSPPSSSATTARRLRMMVLSLPFCAASLTACESAGPMVTQLQRVPVPVAPESLRSCREPPDPPGPDATQRDVANYIARLDDARQDCADKLEALDRWYTDPQPEPAAPRGDWQHPRPPTAAWVVPRQ